MHSPQARIAVAFNEAINARDLGALAELMTKGHTFVDSDGNVLAGRARVLEAWRGFFAAFPDYRNEWAQLVGDDETVIALGRSVCSTEPALDGPAIWTAKIAGGRVAEWRVDDDTSATRRRLGLLSPEDAG
jgi:ketosteroid isomerase-like protein